MTEETLPAQPATPPAEMGGWYAPAAPKPAEGQSPAPALGTENSQTQTNNQPPQTTPATPEGESDDVWGTSGAPEQPKFSAEELALLSKWTNKPDLKAEDAAVLVSRLSTNSEESEGAKPQQPKDEVVQQYLDLVGMGIPAAEAVKFINESLTAQGNLDDEGLVRMTQVAEITPLVRQQIEQELLSGTLSEEEVEERAKELGAEMLNQRMKDFGPAGIKALADVLRAQQKQAQIAKQQELQAKVVNQQKAQREALLQEIKGHIGKQVLGLEITENAATLLSQQAAHLDKLLEDPSNKVKALVALLKGEDAIKIAHRRGYDEATNKAINGTKRTPDTAPPASGVTHKQSSGVQPIMKGWYEKQ